MAYTPFITRAENEVLTNELIDLRLTGGTGTSKLFGVTDNLLTDDRSVNFDGYNMTWNSVNAFTVSGSSNTDTIVDDQEDVYFFVPDINAYFGQFEPAGSLIYIYREDILTLDSITATIEGDEYIYTKGTVNGGQVVFKNDTIWPTDTQLDNIIVTLSVYPNVKLHLGPNQNVSNFVAIDDSGQLFKSSVSPQSVFGNGGAVNVNVNDDYKTLSFTLSDNGDAGTQSVFSLATDGGITMFGTSLTYNYASLATSISYQSAPSFKYYAEQDGNIIIPDPVATTPSLDTVVKQGGNAITNFGALENYSIGTDMYQYNYQLNVSGNRTVLSEYKHGRTNPQNSSIFSVQNRTVNNNSGAESISSIQAGSYFDGDNNPYGEFGISASSPLYGQAYISYRPTDYPGQGIKVFESNNVGLEYFSSFNNAAYPNAIPSVATVQSMIDAGGGSIPDAASVFAVQPSNYITTNDTVNFTATGGGNQNSLDLNTNSIALLAYGASNQTTMYMQGNGVVMQGPSLDFRYGTEMKFTSSNDTVPYTSQGYIITNINNGIKQADNEGNITFTGDEEEFDYTSDAQVFYIANNNYLSITGIYVNGIRLRKADWTLSGTELTIIKTLASGDYVTAAYIK